MTTTQPLNEVHVSLESKARNRSKLLGGIVAVSTVTAWLAFIVNRFLTIHEGWFSYYGFLMRHGKFPYRDFYFFTQPIHLMIVDLVVGINDKLIYYRYYGLCERIAITALLYFILSRSFSTAAAVCGTVASSIIFTVYPTDAYSSYLYTCLLFVLASVACLSEAWRSERRRGVWMFLCGVSAGLAFFSKQSNGLLAILAAGIIILVVCSTVRDAIRDLLLYSAGVIAACLPFVWWIAAHGAWNAYVSQVFLGAASSKGGLRAVLLGFVTRQIDKYSVIAFVGIAAVLCFLYFTKQLSISDGFRPVKQIPALFSIAAIPAWFLFECVIVHQTYGRKQQVFSKADVVLVNVLLYALPIALAYVAYKRFTPGGSTFVWNQRMIVALLVTSFFWTYGCGMSWIVGEQSFIPCLSLAIAFCYDRLQFKNGSLASLAVLLACFGILYVGMWRKWSVAFNWEGWMANVTEANGTHSKFREMSDYYITKYDAHIYDSILKDIAENTKPGEPIVTFPTIPVFNFIGNHPQPTFAPVHYWDVCPDPIARRDAERVRQAKPKMIVELNLADWVWKEHDEGWRKGVRSGQRDFKDTLDSLTSSGEYKLLDTFYTPAYKMPIQVWARKD